MTSAGPSAGKRAPPIRPPVKQQPHVQPFDHVQHPHPPAVAGTDDLRTNHARHSQGTGGENQSGENLRRHNILRMKDGGTGRFGGPIEMCRQSRCNGNGKSIQNTVSGIDAAELPQITPARSAAGRRTTIMWRWLKSTLVDEVIGLITLHQVLRYRNHAPQNGGRLTDFPDLLSGDPQRLFRPVPEPVDLQAAATQLEQHSSATVYDLSFPTGHPTGFSESDQVRGRWFRSCTGGSDLTIVGVDGLVQFNDGWFRALAGELAPYGIDVVMVEPPFSNRRTPAGYRPGQLIVGGDMYHQMSVSRQAVLDLWTVIRGIQQTGRRVGLTGVSYGGWVSLMTSLLADDLDCLSVVAPPVHMGRLIQEGGSITRASRLGLGRGELDPDLLEHVARGVSPLFWPQRIPGSRVVLHAAKWDRFVPTRRICQLAETWHTGYDLHHTGHIGVTTSRKIVRDVAADILAITGNGGEPSGVEVPDASPSVLP
jgi:hypothetical protein